MLIRNSDHIEKLLLLEPDNPLTYEKMPMAFITCTFSGLGFVVLHPLSSPCEVCLGGETVTLGFLCCILLFLLCTWLWRAWHVIVTQIFLSFNFFILNLYLKALS